MPPFPDYLAPSPPPSSNDPVIEELRRRQREEAVLHIVRDTAPPDQAGRANVLARNYGVPAETVERQLPQFEATDRGRRVAELARQYPIFGRWLSNPRNAAVGQDDLEGLARTARALDMRARIAGARLPGPDRQATQAAELRRRYGDLKAPARPAPTFGNFFSGIWESLAGGGQGMSASLDQMLVDSEAWAISQAKSIYGVQATPQLGAFSDRAITPLKRIARAQARVEQATPAFKTRTMRGLYGGVSSLAQMAPAIAASVVTGSPAPALIYAGSTSGASAYGKYRVRGATPGMAAIGGVGEGSVEAATELLPMKFLVGSFGKVGFGQFVAGLAGREIPSEQIATFAQDAFDTAIANPDKTWAQFVEERPGAAYETLVATVTQTLLVGGPSQIARHMNRTADAGEAQGGAEFVEEIMSAAAESKVRTRDPAAFEQFIAQHSTDSPVENLYVPGEKLRELFQSDNFDDEAFFDRYADEIEEAAAIGGDVVIPLAEAAARLAGTPAWEAIRDDVRLSAGGMSLNEAKTFEETKADEMQAMGESIAAETEVELAAREPRDKLAETVRDKLMLAGFRPDVAMQYAELWASRYTARASRLGRDLTGEEAAGLEVRQVLPEKLARAIVPATPETPPDEGLLAVIDIMQRKEGERSDKQKFGLSLLDWIAKQGGIEDRGGDLKSMGLANLKGKSRKGERKLIRAHNRDQMSMLGADGQQNSNSPDELILRAWEEGYFPEFTERPTIDDLKDAIAEGISGRDRYSSDQTTPEDELRAAAQELYQLLDQQGLDPDTATPQEIKRAVEQYQAERMKGRGFEQLEIGATFADLGIRELANQADNELTGAAAKAIDRFIGVAPGTVDDPNGAASGLMDVKALEDAFSDTPSDGGKSIRASLEEAFEPVRAFLRSRFGDAVTLYRYQASVEARKANVIYGSRGESDTRNVLSWTTDPKVAEWMAGVSRDIPQFTEEEIKALEDSFGRTGKAQITRNVSLVQETFKGSDGGDIPYVAIYDERIGFVTDTDSVRAYLEARNVERAERAEGNAAKRSKIITARVSLRDVAWVSDRAGQAEFVVHNRPGSAAFIGPDGKLVRSFEQSLFDDPAQPERTMTRQQRAEIEARQLQSKSRRPNQEAIEGQRDGLFGEPEEQTSLFQSFMDGPRAKITFDDNGKNVIELFEARDLSSFIHESGHLFLEELKADAGGMTNPQVFADYEAVKAWFKREGIKLPKDGTIPTEAHELWARGFERFAMEGKAPSSALKRAFDAFRSWLLNIYKVVDNLKSPISPEIRDVMQRLIATDEEITQAAEEQNIKALFTTAEEAGMTEQEFGAYQNATAEARGEAYDALLYRVMSAIRKQKTQAWRDEEATVKAEVTQAIDVQPVFKALRLITTTAKLSRQWVIDTYGPEAIDQLPRRVPPIHSDKGSHPDEIAEMTGFTSGDEMVRTLMGLEAQRQELRAAGDKRSVRQVQIDEATAQTMLSRNGDILNDGSIEDEARALIHNDQQGEVIASELRALSRRTGQRPTPYALAKEWAANKIAQSKVVEATSGAALQRYERAARNAAKAAEKAMLAQDIDETFRQKQAQMLNNALISEAKKAKDRVEAAAARLGKIAKRATIKSVDQAYLDQAHGLLEQVEFKERSQASLDRQESFEAWAQAQEAAGHDVVVPPSFGASLGTTHWSRLSVEQLLGLDDTVKQIVHLGRLKQSLLDGIERREFNEVVGEAVNAAGLLPPQPPSDLMEPSRWEAIKAKVASADAALLKMETLVDWLDSKNPEGVFNRIIFKPIAQAQAAAADMFKDYIDRLGEAMAAVPQDQLRRWSDRISVPEMINRETGNPFVFTRQQLVSAALNMGNEGNAQRLADGYGWNEAAIMQALNRELSPQEWAYVQNVWDIIDGLWEGIEAVEKRVNGVAPEKIPARALETSAGTLRGGYFPAVYDSTRDYQAERNAAKEGDLFEAKYTRATTRSSATKERAAKVKRPIMLNLGVITRHVGEVIHDITHREAVMNADKFITEPRIMKAIDDTLGPAMRKQFRPWLKSVANQWAMERAGNEGIALFLNKLRTNATVVGMGWRFTTMMIQGAGYSNSFEVVGPSWVTEAVAQTSKDLVGTFKFVMERSGEMRHRMDTLDRDIEAGIRRMAGKANPLTNVKRFAFHGIGFMDRAVVIPTWLGAYNKAMASGMEEDAAIYSADKAVRQSQGAGAAKDLAAVARGTGTGGALLKYLTMFYSYMSAVYQRQRTLGRDIRAARAEDVPGIMARAWWLIVVPPLLSEIMAGRGPDDDEDWSFWSFKQMLMQSLGAIPVVRDIGKPLWDKAAGKQGFDYQLSPMQRAGQSIVEVGGDLGKIARGEETKRATRDAMEAAGYWTGLVPGQFAQSTQFLVDIGYGEQDPEDLGDWYEGLTKGKIKAD